MRQKKEYLTKAFWQGTANQLKPYSKWLDSFLLYLNAVGVLVILYEIGFKEPFHTSIPPSVFYNGLLVAVFLVLTVRTFILVLSNYRKPSLFFEGVLLAFMAVAMVARLILRSQLNSASTLLNFFESEQFIYGIILYVFIVEMSKKTLLFYKSSYHPAQLFVLSFLFLIALGTGLLLLPQASYHGIGWVDALFTATSAVCVTGLVTLDTATVLPLPAK